MFAWGCSQMKRLSGDEKTARWAATVGCWPTGVGSSPADDALDDLCRTLRVSLQQSIWESQMDGETQVTDQMVGISWHGELPWGSNDLTSEKPVLHYITHT